MFKCGVFSKKRITLFCFIGFISYSSISDEFVTSQYLNPDQLRSFIKADISKHKETWLLTGKLTSQYKDGEYQLRYNNIDLSYNGRKLLAGVEFRVSFSSVNEGQAKINKIDELSLLGGINKERKNNGSLFKMSFGKSWK